jgi:hypothetical protein
VFDGARLKFLKDKGAAGADNDEVGEIVFSGDNDAQQQTQFASIVATINDASDGAEEGKLVLNVASHDGESQPGLTNSNVYFIFSITTYYCKTRL